MRSFYRGKKKTWRNPANGIDRDFIGWLMREMKRRILNGTI